MKITLPLFILLLSITAFSQIQVLTTNVDTNDLVYDPITDRIYASIPGSNGVNGNSIGAINPNTSTLVYTVPMGNEPTVLALSDDGQYIYSGFSGESTVRRFIVATKTAGIQVNLGSDATNGALFAEDIEVVPGLATSFVVSRYSKTSGTTHEGIALYDGSTMRPNTTSDAAGSKTIEFSGNGTLFSYNTSTELIGEITVDANGVSATTGLAGILSGDVDFTIHEEILYASDGTVVDVSGTPTVIGQFPAANGPGMYDENFDLVVYASYDDAGVITFKRYNPTTFALVDDTDITQATGSVGNITICGEGCYSFNTSDNKVVIVRNLVLGAKEFMVEPQISMYPNPAKDFFTIKSNRQIKSLSIIDINGRIVSNVSYQTENIDVRNLSQGLYIVKVVDSNDAAFTEKLIIR
ncbi:Por secretion system C-terminal sorting domain-containing protein [Flavobacteriaceae bacterium MAR_2010_188]|nr:Por secretion system C-terminal sorting domain-containing protein [Flavobacteriaceae bacterium MAR_2010_188]